MCEVGDVSWLLGICCRSCGGVFLARTNVVSCFCFCCSCIWTICELFFRGMNLNFRGNIWFRKIKDGGLNFRKIVLLFGKLLTAGFLDRWIIKVWLKFWILINPKWWIKISKHNCHLGTGFLGICWIVGSLDCGQVLEFRKSKMVDWKFNFFI